MNHDLTRLVCLIAEKTLQLEMKLMADLSALNANFVALTDAVSQNTAAVNTVVSELAAASAGVTDQATIDAIANRAKELTDQLAASLAQLKAATAPAAPAA